MRLHANVHKHARGIEVYISIGRSKGGGRGRQGCELPCQSDFFHTDTVSAKVSPNSEFLPQLRGWYPRLGIHGFATDQHGLERNLEADLSVPVVLQK